MALQLFHAGRYVASGANVSGGDALAPLGGVLLLLPEHYPRAITVEEIHRLQAQWAAGAVRAREGGFDAVEIIGSAGYLISQFLSPVTNHRTDEYGGSPENRRRFPLEVIRAVRQAVGPDYPIFLRISGKDFIPGSNGLEEAVAFCPGGGGGGHRPVQRHRRLARDEGAPASRETWPRGGLSYLAAGVKAAVQIPVAACNRINDPARGVEEILAREAPT